MLEHGLLLEQIELIKLRIPFLLLPLQQTSFLLQDSLLTTLGIKSLPHSRLRYSTRLDSFLCLTIVINSASTTSVPWTIPQWAPLSFPVSPLPRNCGTKSSKSRCAAAYPFGRCEILSSRMSPKPPCSNMYGMDPTGFPPSATK